MLAGLRDAFLDALDASVVASFAARSDLGQTLAERIADAYRAHPELEPTPLELAAALARAVPPGELEFDLAKVHVEDLALALACAQSDPRALTKFERLFGVDIERAIARVPDTGLDRDDLRQKVRMKLFTGTERGAVRIASFTGRGSLRAWVRITAMRLGLDLTRRRPEPQHRVAVDADLVERLAEEPAAEIAFLRSRWGPELRAMLEAAIAELSPRHRNLLRYHYLQDLSARKLAELYGVHRATAFRWLEDARAELRRGLAAVARERLEVEPEELESVVALLGSRLDLSIRRIIDSKIEPEERE